MKIGLQTSVRQFKDSGDLKNSTFNPFLRKQNAKFIASRFVKWGLQQIHGLAAIRVGYMQVYLKTQPVVAVLDPQRSPHIRLL